ncbi:UvrB/UvrC motif-containing protein [Janthinobacterium sp. 61]|uniref:UvrB/UvrC motif-containing protein n=1 Tax=Janthinobacterium sp. 61 TaxID=2035209 RepID=UPI000C6FF669|nr:UvrB/UvrC motif-containing protein [Janthinobacterium sp. 61]
MENGSKVYAIDRSGRVICGTAFYDLNGNWQIVTGRYAMTSVWHTAIWARCPGDPRVKRNARDRRLRLEGELAKAIKAMNFERAAVLRDILFPGNPPLFAIWHTESNVYHRAGCRGYTSDLSQAGKFTADEVRGWDCAPNKVIQIAGEQEVCA